MALFNKTSKAIDDIQAQIDQFKTVFDSYVSNGNFYAINKKLEQYEDLRNIYTGQNLYVLKLLPIL